MPRTTFNSISAVYISRFVFETVERGGRLLSSLGLWAVDVALVDVVDDVVGRATCND